MRLPELQNVKSDQSVIAGSRLRMNLNDQGACELWRSTVEGHGFLAYDLVRNKKQGLGKRAAVIV